MDEHLKIVPILAERLNLSVKVRVQTGCSHRVCMMVNILKWSTFSKQLKAHTHTRTHVHRHTTEVHTAVLVVKKFEF